jgi:hypothetical protein
MLILKDQAREFFALKKLPEDLNKSFETLGADYLGREADPPFGDRQFSAGLTWAVVFVNTVLDHTVSIEQVAVHFGLETEDVDDAAAEILEGVKFLDRRYLVPEAAKAIEEQVPIIRSLDTEDPSSVEDVFEEGLRLHDAEEHFDAMVVFYSVLDFLDRLGSKISGENHAAYTCACLSNIGHIFWELEEFDSARQAFEDGIAAAEAVFGPLDNVKLDFHEEAHGPVIFLLEDMASIDYMEGMPGSAMRYFKLVRAADPHGHLGADLAIECLEKNLPWEDYVGRADAAMEATGHEHDEECGCDCDCDGDCDEECDCDHGDENGKK